MRIVRTNRSANAFARGDLTGILMASMPIEAKVASEVGRVRVPVADQEPEALAGIFEIRGEVAGDLGDPRSVRVCGDAEQMDDAGMHLDHE